MIHNESHVPLALGNGTRGRERDWFLAAGSRVRDLLWSKMLNLCLYFCFSTTIDIKMKTWKKVKEAKGEKERVKTKQQFVMGKRKCYRKQTNKNWWMQSHLHPPPTSSLATSTQQLPRALVPVDSLESDPMLHTSPWSLPQREHRFGLQLPFHFI